MRQTILGLVALLLLGAAAAVGWVVARSGLAPGKPDVTQQTEHTSPKSEIWPPEPELLAYLHGRPLEVPASASIFKPFQGFDPDPGSEERAKRREHDVQAWRAAGAIDKDRISELKLGASTIAGPGEPWSTVVSFRYNLGSGHLVTGAVLHKTVGSERAFLGFKVSNVE